MIDKPTAKRQISRMAHLLESPTRGDAFEDLVCAVQVADDEEIARSVVDAFNADELRDMFPSTPEIRSAMNAENERVRQVKQLTPAVENIRKVPLPVGGVFTPGRDPSADRHLELLKIRSKEVAGKKYPFPETETLREIHEIERGWGLRR